MAEHYEVRIVGRVDADGLEVLRDLDASVVTDGLLTVVSGEFDQPTLHGLLERLRMLHLELDDLRRVRALPNGS